MPYTHFRYIAYEVPTATNQPGGDVESGFNAGAECANIATIPVPGDLPADAKIRLKRLALAVQTAYARVVLMGDNANTLKIFLAPEFYFRPPAALGPNYAHDTYPGSVATKIIDTFAGMFVHANFRHWLIVPGTVMWNNSEMSGTGPIVYFNTSFQITGGPALVSGSNLSFIEKRVPSNIDGVPWGPGEDAGLRQVFHNWETRGRHHFTIDNIHCGLEICLDHAASPSQRVLKTITNHALLYEGASPLLHLHLLTAGGMRIQMPSVAAMVNGYMLRNDGYSVDPHSEMRRVLRYTCSDPALRPTRDPGITPSDLYGEAVLDIPVASEWSAPMPPGPGQVPMKGGAYREFPQRIVIYPSTALP